MSRRPPSRRRAFTLVEVVVVIAVVVILAVVLLPYLARSQARSSRIGCANNLKNVGLGMRIWATDNDGEFPWRRPASNGGSGEDASDATRTWRHFAVLSNELSTPTMLRCPHDASRIRATVWTQTPGTPAGAVVFSGNTNLSYFLCLNGREESPETFLAGDRNLTLDGQTVAPSTRFVAGTNSVLGFTAAMHGHAGYVLLGDGSVQGVTSARLAEAWRIAATNTTDKTNNVFLVP